MGKVSRRASWTNRTPIAGTVVPASGHWVSSFAAGRLVRRVAPITWFG